MTISESLFEQICNDKGIKYERISKTGYKIPDYKIRLHDTDIIVEVKQIDPNKDDRERSITVFKYKISVSFFSKAKERIREKIKRASKQLKKYNNQPTILVVYDNTRGFSCLDSYSLLVAMYGDERIRVSDMKEIFSGGKQMTSSERRYISAIGIMNNFKRIPSLSIYHNYYAEHPIKRDLINLIADDQYEIPKMEDNQFNEWKRCL